MRDISMQMSFLFKKTSKVKKENFPMAVKKCVLNFSNFYYWSSLNYLAPFRNFDKIKLINVNLHNFYGPIYFLFKQTDGQTIECDAQPQKE